MTYKIPENVQPITDAELAKIRRSLILYRHPAVNNNLLMKMVRRIECQDTELADRAKTIELLMDNSNGVRAELSEEDWDRVHD